MSRWDSTLGWSCAAVWAWRFNQVHPEDGAVVAAVFMGMAALLSGLRALSAK